MLLQQVVLSAKLLHTHPEVLVVSVQLSWLQLHNTSTVQVLSCGFTYANATERVSSAHTTYTLDFRILGCGRVLSFARAPAGESFSFFVSNRRGK